MTALLTPRLKPCPHCDSTVIDFCTHGRDAYFGCGDCEMRGPLGEYDGPPADLGTVMDAAENAAARLWNGLPRRTNPQPAPEPRQEPPWAELDPGVAGVVRFLWERGFNPTDSGDGRSKPAEARAFDCPHVFCRVPAARLAFEVDRANRLLRPLKGRWTAEGSYADGVALIMCLGVEPDVDSGAQPAPVARGPEVFPVVLKAIDRYGESSGRDVAQLRALVEQRRAFGLEKYKVTLHRDDGRDPVKDATDEVGDLPGYLMRLLMLEEFGAAAHCLGMLAQVGTLCLEELRAALMRAIERERAQQEQGG